MALPEPDLENQWLSGSEESEDESEDEIRANLEFDFGNVDMDLEDIPANAVENNDQANDPIDPENQPEIEVVPEVANEVFSRIYD